MFGSLFVFNFISNWVYIINSHFKAVNKQVVEFYLIDINLFKRLEYFLWFLKELCEFIKLRLGTSKPNSI